MQILTARKNEAEVRISDIEDKTMNNKEAEKRATTGSGRVNSKDK